MSEPQIMKADHVFLILSDFQTHNTINNGHSIIYSMLYRSIVSRHCI